MSNTTKIVVIPDTQVKPGVNTDHLEWAGKYIVDKKPDVIVHIGDHWDMESLSSYDVGKKSFEGRRYKKDVEAGNDAMHRLVGPINKEVKRLQKNKKKVWRPRMVFTLGNHCHRIERAIDKDAILEDTIGYHDLYLDDWEVFPYLTPVEICGIMFSHFFTSGVMGRPVSSARALLNKKHMSCVMGHVQDKDIAFDKKANGQSITGLFAGIFYQHDEGYLGQQGNDSWRGIWTLFADGKGGFNEIPVPMHYLKEKYGA